MAVWAEVQRLTRLINTAQQQLLNLMRQLQPTQKVRAVEKPRLRRQKSKATQKQKNPCKAGTPGVKPLGVPPTKCPVVWRNRAKWTKAQKRFLVRTKGVARGHYLLGWLQDSGVTYLRLSGRLIVPLSQVKKASCEGVTLTSHKSLLAILRGEKEFVPQPRTLKRRVHKPTAVPARRGDKAPPADKPLSRALDEASPRTSGPAPAHASNMGNVRADSEERYRLFLWKKDRYQACCACGMEIWYLPSEEPTECPKCGRRDLAFLH